MKRNFEIIAFQFPLVVIGHLFVSSSLMPHSFSDIAPQGENFRSMRMNYLNSILLWRFGEL